MVCQNADHEYLTENNTGIITLLQKYDQLGHPEQSEKTDALAVAKSKISQVVVEYHTKSNNMVDKYEIHIALWSSTAQLTEEFSLELPLRQDAAFKGVFKNVEVDERTMVVCRVVHVVSELEEKKTPANRLPFASIRRPEAVGGMPLRDALARGTDAMPFYAVSSDVLFADAPLLVASGRLDPGLVLLRNREVAVDVTLRRLDCLYEDALQGELSSPKIAVCSVLRGGEIPVPDPARNSVYVTLDSGRFTQGKNIQVTLTVRNDQGVAERSCLAVGSLDPRDQMGSFVCLGTQTPVWKETVRVSLPPDRLRAAHLLFTIKQRSAKQDKVTPFAFAFLKLTNPDGSLVGDGPITLDCYKHTSNTPPSVAYLTQAVSSSAGGIAPGAAGATGAGGAATGISSSIDMSNNNNNNNNNGGPLRHSESGAFAPRRNESLVVSVTSFCKIPRSPQIAALTQWQQLPGQTDMLLDGILCAMGGDEFVTFLPDVLRALFEILQANDARTPLGKKCFQTLVRVLGASPLVDAKNKRYVLVKAHLEQETDRLVEALSRVHYALMAGIEASFESADNSLRMQTMKALHAMFRFIVTSRIAEMRGQITSPRDDTAFKQTLTHFFELLSTTVGSTSTQATALRAITVKNFDQVLLLMGKFFTRQELCRVFLGFLSKALFEKEAPTKNTVSVALQMEVGLFFRVLETVLPIDDETAPVLMPTICDIIRSHPQESVPLLVVVVEFLSLNRESPVVADCLNDIIPVMPQIMQLLKMIYDTSDPCCSGSGSSSVAGSAGSTQGNKQHKEESCRAESTQKLITQLFSKTITEKQLVVTSFLGLLSVMRFMEVLDGVIDVFAAQEMDGSADAGLRHFLSDTFGVLTAICTDAELYPASWFSMNMFKEQTSLHIIYYSKDKLIARAAKAAPATAEGDAEMAVWTAFLRLCIVLVGRYTVFDWSRFPDPELYKDSWSNPPEYVIPVVRDECFPVVPRKARLLPLLSAVLRLLALSSELPAIGPFVGDLYYGIALGEYRETGKFARAATLSCETVDAAMTDWRNGKRRGVVACDVFQRFFGEDIRGRFAAAAADGDSGDSDSNGSDGDSNNIAAVRAAGTEFVQSILNLLQLEMEYDAIPDSAAEERAGVTIRMMDYFVNFEISRYFRYVHMLYHLHRRENGAKEGEAASYAEAGCTILLHATRLGWTDEPLPALELQSGVAPLPAEPSWARRQRLYRDAADCFTRAGLHERSLDLLRELEVFHTLRRDFAQLAGLLKDEADCYAAIAQPARTFPRYFLLSYYGRGFSIVYANKQCVYRGEPRDTVDSVTARLRARFPAAAFRPAVAPADADALRDAPGQLIVVALLEPSSEPEARGEPRVFPARMPPSLREYHRCNNTSVFVLADPAAHTRTFFFTEDSFPGTRRRSDVIRTVTVAAPEQEPETATESEETTAVPVDASSSS